MLGQGPISGICGYASEKDVWILLKDVASALKSVMDGGSVVSYVSVDNVFISDAGGMMLNCPECILKAGSKLSDKRVDKAFIAPELSIGSGLITEKSEVWSLGATAFCLLMGVKVFGGQGGSVQNKTTYVPCFNDEVYTPELCEITKRCLSFDPADRPGLDEIILKSGLALSKMCPEARKKKVKTLRPTENGLEYWPESMNE